MPKPLRRLPTRHRNQSLRFEPNRLALRRLLFYTVCGVILSAGFSFAVWQHFAAIRYGYGMEDLRREKAQLEAERQRLEVAREQVVALPNLENAARAVGLQTMQGPQLEVARHRQAAPSNRPPRAN
jgi:hypothetical protein